MKILSRLKIQAANWFDTLTERQKKEYLKEHPDSKYAKNYKPKSLKKESPWKNSGKGEQEWKDYYKDFEGKSEDELFDLRDSINKNLVNLEKEMTKLVKPLGINRQTLLNHLYDAQDRKKLDSLDAPEEFKKSLMDFEKTLKNKKDLNEYVSRATNIENRDWYENYY